MPWIKEVCTDFVCGACLSTVKSAFGLSLFTNQEAEEISSLKNLAISVIQKCPSMATDDLLCEAVKKGQSFALERFAQTASPEAITAGAITASQLVCSKAFKKRFTDVLMGACLNTI